MRGCDAHINVHTSCMLCVSVCGDEEPWSLVPWTVCGACWVDGGSRLSTPLTPLAERPCVRSVKYGAPTSRLTLYIYICIKYTALRGSLMSVFLRLIVKYKQNQTVSDRCVCIPHMVIKIKRVNYSIIAILYYKYERGNIAFSLLSLLSLLCLEL